MFCPSCGKEIPDHFGFCLVCGKAIHVVAHPSGFVPPPVGALVPQRPRFHLYLVAGGSLLAALAIVAILFMVFGRSKAPGTSSTAAALPSSEIATNKPSPSPLPPVPLGTAQIAELATPSVVVVENYNEDGQKAELGSGYVFSPDGIVMTNYHVVRGAASLAVKIPGREETRVDSLLGYDGQFPGTGHVRERGRKHPAKSEVYLEPCLLSLMTSQV